ncbi:MAG: YceI family protein [Candidatus Thiodiazotropha sp. (ex Dulcina madagascariensis)]|nr:YceI family protein [Candidatus Thiodiazotropha sp. (ex Epidulcina cf. delphinae)]MCU7921699.1 YceI family protein [Candidatus Thiodiazotropha sp. (ex Dulcina madagascariensis)]MCU7926052.1 YceI family protein [Candidatus Thiodiazotropha sp. (ex Dulcina madagascariensis)]
MNRYFTSVFIAALIMTTPLSAEEYVIDNKGAHAFIQFRIKHLGYSWLFGRFNAFSGHFSYDEKNPSAARIAVDINPASIDSNHAERDKHLRSEEFLHVDKYPTAKFVSTAYQEKADGSAVLKGDFTLRGVTKPVAIAVEKIGHGKDPWGGYRRGFFGTTEIALKDFGIPFDLGPASRTVQLELSVEGIRQ